MSEPSKRESVYIPFRISKKQAEQLNKAAVLKHTSKSALIREYINKGLKSDGYKADDERVLAMIKQAVSEITKPQVERLAAISAKATHIAAAAFFMEIYAARLQLDATDRGLVDDMAGRARKLGIEYLKLNDRDLDEFLTSGAKRMKSTEED